MGVLMSLGQAKQLGRGVADARQTIRGALLDSICFGLVILIKSFTRFVWRCLLQSHACSTSRLRLWLRHRSWGFPPMCFSDSFDFITQDAGIYSFCHACAYWSVPEECEHYWYYHFDDYFPAVLSRRTTVSDTGHKCFDSISDLFAIIACLSIRFSLFFLMGGYPFYMVGSTALCTEGHENWLNVAVALIVSHTRSSPNWVYTL